MLNAKAISMIKDRLQCSLADSRTIYLSMAERIMESEKSKLLNEIFLQDPDEMCKHYEHRALRVDWFLENKYKIKDSL